MIILLWSFSDHASRLLAQDSSLDSMNLIPTIEIKASKLRQNSTGSVIKEWNTAQLNRLTLNNLAELLSNETGTYIKSYGQGSLATSSVRGGSAGHTLVLWNGLPIQSPMLGLVDLSLLPIQLAESVNFTKGGNAALWGSGAIGGVISMNNESDYSNRLSANTSTLFGSFGQFNQQVNLNIGHSKFQSRTKISHQQSNNDFYYYVGDGLGERQQTNARFSQQFFNQDFYWKVNSTNHLSIHYWLQFSDRQIPPTTVQNRSEAYQEDLINRLLLQYKYTESNGSLNIKMALFDEDLNYTDEQILLESKNHFRTWLGEITREWFYDKHKFLIGNLHNFTQASSPGYQEVVPKEYRTALFSSWKYIAKNIQTQVSLRQGLVDGELIPIVPSFSFDLALLSQVNLKGKVNRNYRLPTLNDRYWIPGGNVDLLPESGWSEELTALYKGEIGSFQLETGITAFNRNIENWILWRATDNQFFYSASNIAKVWSRGFEPRFSLSFINQNVQWKFISGYDYILSTNQVPVTTPKIEVGEQLLYTPVHQIFGQSSVQWNNFYCAYQMRFTGSSQGINESVDPFTIGNIQLQYTYEVDKVKGTVFFHISNIWDTDYQIIERRPMPGINFQTGIKLLFSK